MDLHSCGEEVALWAVLEELTSALAMLEMAQRNRQAICSFLRTAGGDCGEAVRCQEAHLSSLSGQREQLLSEAKAAEAQLLTLISSRGGEQTRGGRKQGRTVDLEEAVSWGRRHQLSKPFRLLSSLSSRRALLRHLMRLATSCCVLSVKHKALHKWAERRHARAQMRRLRRRGDAHWQRGMVVAALSKWVAAWRGALAVLQQGRRVRLRRRVEQAYAVAMTWRTWLAYSHRCRDAREAVVVSLHRTLLSALSMWTSFLESRFLTLALAARASRGELQSAFRSSLCVWRLHASALAQRRTVCRRERTRWMRQSQAGAMRTWHEWRKGRRQLRFVLQVWLNPALRGAIAQLWEHRCGANRRQACAVAWVRRVVAASLRQWVEGASSRHMSSTSRQHISPTWASFRRWSARYLHAKLLRKVCFRWRHAAVVAAFKRLQAHRVQRNALEGALVTWQGVALASGFVGWRGSSESARGVEATRWRVMAQWRSQSMSMALRAWWVRVEKGLVARRIVKVWINAELKWAVEGWLLWRRACAYTARLQQRAVARFTRPALASAIARWWDRGVEEHRLHRKARLWVQSQVCCVMLGFLSRWLARAKARQVLLVTVLIWVRRWLGSAFHTWLVHSNSRGHSFALGDETRRRARRFSLAASISKWRQRTESSHRLRFGLFRWFGSAGGTALAKWRRWVEAYMAMKTDLVCMRNRRFRAALLQWATVTEEARRQKWLMRRGVAFLTKGRLLRALRVWKCDGVGEDRSVLRQMVMWWRARVIAKAWASWISERKAGLLALSRRRRAVAMWHRREGAIALASWRAQATARQGEAKAIVSASRRLLSQALGRAFSWWLLAARGIDQLERASLLWRHRKKARALVRMLEARCIWRETRSHAAKWHHHVRSAAWRRWGEKARYTPPKAPLPGHKVKARALRRALFAWRSLSLSLPLSRQLHASTARTTLARAVVSWRHAAFIRAVRSCRPSSVRAAAPYREVASRACWERWREEGVLRAQALQLVERATRSWAAIALARGLTAWRFMSKQRVAVREVRCRIQRAHHGRALVAWRDVRGKRAQARKAITRSSRVAKGKALHCWASVSRTISRRRHQMERMRNRRASSRRADTFRLLLAATTELKLQGEAKQRALAVRRKRTAADCMATWRDHTTELRSLFVTGYRVLHMRAEALLARWARLAASHRTNRGRTLTWLLMWRAHVISRGWLAIVDAGREGMLLLSRATRKWVTGKLSSALRLWAGSAAVRVISRQRLSCAAARWRAVRLSLNVCPTIIISLRLANGFKQWQARGLALAQWWRLHVRAGLSLLHRGARLCWERWRREASRVGWRREQALLAAHHRRRLLLSCALAAWGRTCRQHSRRRHALAAWTGGATSKSIFIWRELASRSLQASNLRSSALARWAWRSRLASLRLWCRRHARVRMTQHAACLFRCRGLAVSLEMWHSAAQRETLTDGLMTRWVQHAVLAALRSAFSQWGAQVASISLQSLQANAISRLSRPRMARCFLAWISRAEAQMLLNSADQHASASLKPDCFAMSNSFHLWRSVCSCSWRDAERAQLLRDLARQAAEEIEAARSLAAKWKSFSCPALVASPVQEVKVDEQNRSYYTTLTQEVDAILAWASATRENSCIG